MAPNVYLGAGSALASAGYPPRAWRDAIRATIHRNDVHAGVAKPTDRLTGPLSWLRPLDVPSFWEQALLAVLFLLIGGLVALRLAEAASDRDLERPVSSLRSGSDGDSDDADRPGDTSDPHSTGTARDSRDTDHRRYERYLSPETPPELLSDEGKVVRLLVANDGRIRQHEITDETGWSKSKVSRICSQMHADGIIEKRPVGRENVITLSDDEADDADDRDRDATTQSDDVETPLP